MTSKKIKSNAKRIKRRIAGVVRKGPKRSNYRAGLSAAASDYAKLLMDPCRARLVHPVYSGSEGGLLIRTEAFTTTGNLAGITSGIFHFTPGAIGTANSEFLLASGATASTNITAAGFGVAPGKTFITNNACAVRVVSACVTVTYPGTELDRSGRVHYGHTSGSLIDIGTVVTADGVAGSLEGFERTPANKIEIIWKPNDADQLFTDPTAATGAAEKDRKAAITVAWAGLPAAVGLTFHTVVVYEYQPERALGIANPSMNRSLASETLDQVLNYIQNSGFKYVASTANMAMQSVMRSYGRRAPSMLTY